MKIRIPVLSLPLSFSVIFLGTSPHPTPEVPMLLGTKGSGAQEQLKEVSTYHPENAG